MNTQNVVVLTGNLGADPERRSSDAGAITKLLLAQNVRRFDQDKKAYETVHTNWIRVTCFGRLAERIGAGLKKGNRVTVMGELRSNDYEAKDGTKRTSVEVFARDVIRSEFVTGNSSGVDLPDFNEFQDSSIGSDISL
ncbi:MAG: hypothetical protein A2603_05930 [Bdellovibrionales bacterium RIFOXYD1_FULL_55_31]|nr:MAG: hypothetical protein A2603_05930 [Bdellovibrionales bacterium RIFOXYD1_FULL_55_31]